jgi:hypothetical protein
MNHQQTRKRSDRIISALPLSFNDGARLFFFSFLSVWVRCAELAHTVHVRMGPTASEGGITLRQARRRHLPRIDHRPRFPS